MFVQSFTICDFTFRSQLTGEVFSSSFQCIFNHHGRDFNDQRRILYMECPRWVIFSCIFEHDFSDFCQPNLMEFEDNMSIGVAMNPFW